MSVNKINPVLEATVMKPLRWVSESSTIKKAGQHVYNNNRKYIDGLGVASIVAKDGLGCYLYVTQSLNNKDIPDDKRKFVASLDLTNGLLMIGFQLLMFFVTRSALGKLFEKTCGSMFNRSAKKAYQQILKNKPGFEDLNNIKYTQEFEKIRDNIKDAFIGIASLASATIVGKRMLVPFIATPLAGKVEKKMNEKANKKQNQNPTTNVADDKSNPSMKGAEKIDNPQNNPEPAKVEQPKMQEQTGSTNLLQKYKK